MQVKSVHTYQLHLLEDIIDFFTQEITGALLKAARVSVPPKIYHKFKRPDWNDDLRSTHLLEKNAHRRWKQAGKPTDPNHKLRVEYKLHK